MVEPISVEDGMDKRTLTFEGHPAEKPLTEVDKKPLENDEPIKEETKEPEKEEFKFKYASQEAAETAYKDAEKLIGKSTSEAKRERERAEALQEQLNTALKVKEPKNPASSKPTSVDKMKDLLEQVNLLDPEDKDYQLKVAKIWGQREDDIQANVEVKVTEALDSYDKAVKEKQDQVREENSKQKSTISEAETAGKEAGLDMKKDSTDSTMFWTFADKAPEGSIDEQIVWTVKEVKKIKDAYAAPTIKAEEEAAKVAEKAKATQEQNSLLERQGVGRQPDKAVPATPLGIAAGLQQIQRRI